jgi:uncharacterized repeat protein (TIGR01451 family)
MRLTPPLHSRKGIFARIATGLLFTAMLVASPIHRALAQGTAPPLGTANSFVVLGGQSVTNTGPSVITGDLGVSPGTAVTGFPPGTVVGTIHAADAQALQAQADNTTAYNDLAGEACNTTFGVPTDLSGLTLVPGVYCFASSAGLTGTVTLDAQGDPNSVFIFKIGSTLITGSSSTVALINGAQQCNVFWQVGSSATLGTSTNFIGNILALTSITLDTNAILSGRALAQTGSVTLDSNIITAPTCAAPQLNAPPTIAKAFAPPTIQAGGTSTLTLTLTNTDATNATLSSSLTDSLPTGVSIVGNAVTTCGGTLIAAAGGTSVSLSGGAIPANGLCTVTVDVTAAAAGNYINTVPVGALVTSNGNNAGQANATLSVTPASTPTPAAPTLAKAFTPASITAGGASTLVITLSNSNAVVDNLTAALTDTLPVGTTATGTATTTCVGGTATAAAGGSTVTLTGGVIPANGSCTITASINAVAAGSFLNSIAAGALQTDNGSNSSPANATLTVNAGTPALVAPTLAKSFTPASVVLGAPSSLILTLSNNNAVVDTLTAPLIDTLPTGMTASGSASTTCVGGVVTATSGSTTVTLTGGAIPANGSCTVTVGVAETVAGAYLNSIAAGGLQTNNGNNGSPATASLNVSAAAPVLVAPTLGKSFSQSSIALGAAANVILTLSNSNATVDTLTAPLTDHLPLGMTASGSVSTTCGGVATAVKGGSTVTLTGGAIPANGSCTITAGVVEDCACAYHNSLPIGALQTTTGSNAAAAVATLTVSAAPASGGTPGLKKYFYPAEIKPGGSTGLTITLSNPNATVAKLTAPFVDHLPLGTLVFNSSATTTCVGTLTAVKGSTSITLTNGQIPANGSCAITAFITAPKAGVFVNSLQIGVLKTNHGNNATVANATLTVSAAAGGGTALLKSFSPSTITNDGVSTLTITLKNPSPTPAKLTAPLHDFMPTHMVVFGSASNTCGGVVTANKGSSTVTLTGGTIPANGSCTVTVKVTAPCANYFNNIGAGALQTSIGSNQEPAGAALTVEPTTTVIP